MTIVWKKWDEGVIRETHGNIMLYRKLYEGEHVEVFPRAKKLIEQGEIVDNIYNGRSRVLNQQTPYIIANFCKLITEIPADLVSRAIGTISPANDENKTPEVVQAQQELLDNIVALSDLDTEHWTNILHHQLDGGVVGCAWKDENGTYIETKAREVYFPHEDGNGIDLAYKRKFPEREDEEFLHVYRERVEKKNLETEHMLFRIKEDNKLEQLEEPDVKELLGMENLKATYIGRNKPFIVYWANDKTFMNPLGVSVLKNQASKQDEINWTLTRNAVVYERNGKPRLAVSKEVFRALQERAFERYGDESKIDHRDLEILTFDEQGKSLEVIQIDITKIGDIEWVKDLARVMFYETKTSASAIDFETEHSRGAQSGISKFYDLFVSIVKAEKIAKEYVKFLQNLLENCLWLENLENEAIPVEKPDVALHDIVPITRKEMIEGEAMAYEKGIQSLYETVKRLKPNDSRESIEDEVALIEEERQQTDTIGTNATRDALDKILKGEGQQTGEE